MLYGDLITLSTHGLLLDSKAVLPIGIFDKSICWALWVPDATGREPAHKAHLVVSSLHPRCWPFLLRIELKLKEEKGSMADAAQMLAQQKMNIQFGESSPSGHHHATWNVVCEAVAVRKQFERQVREFQERRIHDPAAVNALATEISQALYAEGYHLRERMEDEGKFLHPRSLDKDEPRILHIVERFTDKKAIELAKADTSPAVRIRWIQNLPTFALYGLNPAQPLAFRYDRGRSILCAEDPDAFSRTLHHQGLSELPTRAIASIYPEEHHVRLLPVREKAKLKHMVQVDVTYNAEFDAPSTMPPSAEGDTTMGFWSETCEKLAFRGLNLQRVTNKTVRHEPSAEKGVLTLIGIPDDSSGSLDQDELKADLHRVRSVPGRNITIEEMTISPLSLERVFISRRMDAHDGEALVKIVKNCARVYGLHAEVVEPEFGENLQRVVIDRIGRCDAMFQIITASAAEYDALRRDGKKDVHPDLHWLSFEYGVAMGKGIPVVRLVDESVFTLEEWTHHTRIGAGDVWATYSLREREKLEEKFDAAMRRLAGKVHRNLAED